MAQSNNLILSLLIPSFLTLSLSKGEGRRTRSRTDGSEIPDTALTSDF